ncbi:glycosyltransferase [Candidatus Woesearchaeota archaeon]|nr:glycosyltransferase [Candidatus Woesearchaeota archaeon]
MKEPLFSILMANYNSARYIKQAIESVLNQTYSNWELIIVDDASTDNSLEIIKPYLKDKRIKLIKLKRNLGPGGAKKICADNASGEIFGILDSDDYLDKNALKIMVKEYNKNKDYGVICSIYYKFYEDSGIQEIDKVRKVSEPQKSYLEGSGISHFSTFKKQAYNKTKGFDPEVGRADDKDLFYKFEEAFIKSKFIEKPLYYYRMHNKAKENSVKKIRYYGTLAKYKAYQRRENMKNIYNLSKKEISSLLSNEVKNLINQRNLKVAKDFLQKLIKLNPLKLKYLLQYMKFLFLRINQRRF